MLKVISRTLLEGLTPTQSEAVTHEGSPLLIVAGAGTGKTTVVTRRIAWLITEKHVRPEEILALTFTEKAVLEMEERIDLLVPYGYTDTAIKTFHAFGDQLIRDQALRSGLSPNFRVLSKQEQILFLKQRIFDLPIDRLRPLSDPDRFLNALTTIFGRAKDEAVTPEVFTEYADSLQTEKKDLPLQHPDRIEAERLMEVANCYKVYGKLLTESDSADFGDQVLLAIRLLEDNQDLLTILQERYRYILVDEFQDTNYSQFRLLQLLAKSNSNITVVADDDQSIYQWRGAAISNVIKYLDQYPKTRTIVLTDNFRSSQPILDHAYRLIRFNDPDRLEIRNDIDKRLIAKTSDSKQPPELHMFDTASSEADWVAKTIRAGIENDKRRPGEFAILVRSNREADIFLRALNVGGIPWRFSGSGGLFARGETKMLLSCLKTLMDPDDSLSWYHVASSMMYLTPMKDLAYILAESKRTNKSFSSVITQLTTNAELQDKISEEGKTLFAELVMDVNRLLESSRDLSCGQVLYRWLTDRGLLSRWSKEQRLEDLLQLQTVARFFDHLHRMEYLIGSSLAELMHHMDFFQAIGREVPDEDDLWTDRVNVLTLHKAKGLEFPIVYMVGLIQGRFPSIRRRDPIQLPRALIKDILPKGDYHLQEERRLFYVGMTRAKEQLHFTAAYDYGGKTVRKVSQFVLESLSLTRTNPPAQVATARERLQRLTVAKPIPVNYGPHRSSRLRLDPHGADDYLTCPLKYQYSHVLKIPVMRHHLVVYGSALHKALEEFFKRRLQKEEMTEPELLEVFKSQWHPDGFLTREHETLRYQEGQQTLKRFYQKQQINPEYPTLIEEKFKFPLDNMLIVGRWDRVDRDGDRVTIIDYKSSDVKEQVEANRRAKSSFQLLVYTLAWRTLYGQMPSHVELRFLGTDITGKATFKEADLERVRDMLRRAAQGIRAREFQASPQEFGCKWCAFQSICPHAFKPAL